ncbi:leucine-rich repeat-containing protein 3B-like isoform X1 [Styela clava]
MKVRKWMMCLLILTCSMQIRIIAGEDDNIECPLGCMCFPVEENEMYDPPTYSRVSVLSNETVIAVSCLRQQLTKVPTGFAPNTAALFLSYNDLSQLNRSMFAGLNKLKILDISHNKLVSIANDTFDDMRELEQLDLSYNKIRWLPNGFLCPWYRQGFGTHLSNPISCKGWITAKTQLQLVLGENPWHCNCALQQFVEQFSCAYEQAPCIDFSIGKDDPIGHCGSPPNMRGISLTRLSSFESQKGHINVCKYRQVYIDVPLLVTMFTWIGAVLGYVAYFISWNNRDIANHRSYLSTLNFRQQESHHRGQGEQSAMRTTNSSPTVPGDSSNARRIFQRRNENKEIQKDLPTVEITEVNSPDIWIERPNWDFETHSDECLLQPRARIIEVEPARRSSEEKTSRGSMENIQGNHKQIDIYHLSSL